MASIPAANPAALPIRSEPAPPPSGPVAAETAEAAALHASVYAELRGRLLTGRIIPGVGLSTRGLAQELGVSQMPVREALSRLAARRAGEVRSKHRIGGEP